MTAEIAVMNKSAIALAADSKVTVTIAGVTKTYDTVSKLFTLSKVAPVGIMVYGNADFMGFPWETIIKMYRSNKGSRTHQTILEWAEDFFKFLKKVGPISKQQKDRNVKDILISTLNDTVKQIEDWASNNGLSHGSEEFNAFILSTLEKKFRTISDEEPWLTKSAMKTIITRYSRDVVDVVKAYLEGYSDEIKSAAVSLLVATLVLKSTSPQSSGVVIAGFGDSEYFPTLVDYQTDGYIGDRIKVWLVGPVVDVSREMTACIRPFAQGDMVSRFMNGIDPFYSAYLSAAIPELVVDNCFDTLVKYGVKRSNTEAVRNTIRSAVNDAVDGFEREAQNYRKLRFSDPVIRMVSVLPKDELAHLAESLVALTSLKRRVSSDAETVGGPVDVALISKGDGFIWVKRKHYFREELNPQFVRNYMNDTLKGEESDAGKKRASGARRAAAERPSQG